MGIISLLGQVISRPGLPLDPSHGGWEARLIESRIGHLSSSLQPTIAIGDEL